MCLYPNWAILFLGGLTKMLPNEEVSRDNQSGLKLIVLSCTDITFDDDIPSDEGLPMYGIYSFRLPISNVPAFKEDAKKSWRCFQDRKRPKALVRI